MKRNSWLFLCYANWLIAMLWLVAATPQSFVFFVTFLSLAASCLIMSDKVR